ncbi:uncharacterized protein LOC8285011 isoform X2 [Ricinus communis]|uniref:ATP binding protein, putative n=1 Tax=Ricinus communis TaxID=3988 RepID=B9RWA8_RICCO|nr:uncharacterized protein LOC8285011 isoform X2 [Ricinus communis]EEF44545.1 ATP binding protein, putative [Ricinus communis]|eukprot:XP_015573966.1 uncharacterized protein LOC8285011 isoform X2 [Ricinus communis]
MSNSYPKNSQVRGKSQGWAAFDLNQRQKGHQKQPQVVVDTGNTNGNDDPFPPLPTTTTSLRPCGNNALPATARSFSSVFIPSADFPPISDNISDSTFNELKQLHSWADSSLIQDVMYSVNNDFHMAASFLNTILSSTHNSVGNGRIEKYLSTSHDPQSEKVRSECSFSENTSDLAADIVELSSTLEEALTHNHNELAAACGQGEALSQAAANMNLILGHLKSIPVEPEWEEHNLYLKHRRNALKITRLASRHSRAATNAFLRGDHFSAQQESLKARKEWLDAERLNAEAAKEILNITNSENNPWKLDLHGLHAAEAVQALQEHLKKIETQLSVKRLVSPGRVKTKNGIICSLIEPFSNMDVENLDIQRVGFRQRPASLLVITGIFLCLVHMRYFLYIISVASSIVFGARHEDPRLMA